MLKSEISSLALLPRLGDVAVVVGEEHLGRGVTHLDHQAGELGEVVAGECVAADVLGPFGDPRPRPRLAVVTVEVYLQADRPFILRVGFEPGDALGCHLDAALSRDSALGCTDKNVLVLPGDVLPFGTFEFGGTGTGEAREGEEERHVLCGVQQVAD